MPPDSKNTGKDADKGKPDPSGKLDKPVEVKAKDQVDPGDKSASQLSQNQGKVADNKNLTASVPGSEGRDPQPPLDAPLSTDPANQLPGGTSFPTRQVPEGHSDLSAQEKLNLYLDTFVETTDPTRIVFGSVNVAITVADLRELAGRDG